MASLPDLFRNLKEKLVVGLSRKMHSPIVHFATEEDRQLWDEFEAWMVEYEKSYSSFAEKEKRFEIFKEKVREIERHNALNKSYRKGLTQFTDLTYQEFRHINSGCYPEPDDETEETLVREKFEAWMVEYEKSYDNVTEKEKRFMIFKTNLQDSENNKFWKKEVDEFSDLTLQEYMHTYVLPLY